VSELARSHASKAPLPSFQEVFEGHVAYVYRLVLHLGVPVRHAEDVCQEIFLVVSRRLSECDDPEHLKTWLYAIAWRVAYAHRRLARNQNETPVADPAEHLVESTGPAEQLEERRRLERLGRALDALTDQQRVVFILYEIEQLRMREVAVALDCSINTAFSRLYAARRRVAEELGIQVPEEVWKR
jgi:RNA polymerase sigma-70 factor (ECF subfamily)